jgi:phosphoglycerate dehydrogenase-like enzyme
MTEPFRVGLTSGFRDANGQLAFGDIGLDLLDQEPGLEYEFFTPNQPYVTPNQVAGYDGIIALGGRYTSDTLAGSSRLMAIGRFGVGYDTVDVDACTAADVALFITPDGVRRPVATSILAFVLALSHKLVIKNDQTHAGDMDGLRRTIGTGLTGRVLGSVGMGNIGAELFRLAAPLGMQGMVYDPFIRPDVATELGVQMVDLETLLRSSDFLAINCPLSAATRGLIGEAQLRQMQPSAYLINTARGPIVDTAALTSALRDGRLAGAGLDVTDPEPLPTDHPLLAMDNVIVTSHRLAWTDDMVLGTGQATMTGMCKLARGEPPSNVVNTGVLSRPGFQARLRARR